MQKINKLLVANRSEIAIRIFRAATELNIKTVAIYGHEDRFSLHRFKADESYLVGHGMEPIAAYLSVDEVIRVALESGADAVHPGYGFLSESPELADACNANGLIFVGPSSKILSDLGDKVSARELALNANVPVVPATDALPDDVDAILAEADKVGLPVMIKASWGGGGRGMRRVMDRASLLEEVQEAKRESQAAFGKDEVYLEKLIQRARHVEVQVLGDSAGNVVHLYERDCSVQRRNQKVVEMAPAHWMDEDVRQAMLDAAVRLAKTAGYENAGTVEFLYDLDTEDFYFIEVNPRVQVEHTVTEEVTGLDIVQAQILIAQGGLIGGVGEQASGIPSQDKIQTKGYAVQCRVTTEDPENSFMPDYGRISAYRSANGHGVRLDGGNGFSGAQVTPHYDSLLVKVIIHAPRRDTALRRMDRVLREFRIRGVKTNLPFLIGLIKHHKFQSGDFTTRFIDETPELFEFKKRKDRASRLLSYVADTLVNGNPEVVGMNEVRSPLARLPEVEVEQKQGSREIFLERGAEGLRDWVLAQDRLLITDTTFRDAHQSLLATRMRSADLLAPMPAYQAGMRGLFSIENWGGATFDVSMRFLKESPWERLHQMRQACPDILFQMLLRGSNGVGYTSYPDNVVEYFIDKAADAGMDLFRVFDSLNWVDNMRVSFDRVLKTGAILEATICYTGDLASDTETTYTLDYYVEMARELKASGAHIIALKDMAGLLKPQAARILIPAIKEETGLPIHFHTHDTSGGALATQLAAAEVGADIIDGAMDALSGGTSQPNLGTLQEMLRNTVRDPNLNRKNLDEINSYWEQARAHYAMFESASNSGSSDVYIHEMPGGQFTNLKAQAKALGVGANWPLVVERYAQVNQMFGNIVKVTPSSKVVGDLAIYMVSHKLSPEDIIDPDKEIAFPDSVVSLMRGELGQPVNPFPQKLQAKVLRGDKPIVGRPGAALPPADLEAERLKIAKGLDLPIEQISDEDLAAYLMYPRVFMDYSKDILEFGPVTKLPTPIFFWGPEEGQEFFVDLEKGQRLYIRYLAISDPDRKGKRTAFFELNGQPRNATVVDRSAAPAEAARAQADGSPGQVGAPMPGTVTGLSVKLGQHVEKGDALLGIEAMKMETTIFAEVSGTVTEISVAAGDAVETKELLVIIEDD